MVRSGYPTGGFRNHLAAKRKALKPSWISPARSSNLMAPLSISMAWPWFSMAWPSFSTARPSVSMEAQSVSMVRTIDSDDGAIHFDSHRHRLMTAVIDLAGPGIDFDDAAIDPDDAAIVSLRCAGRFFGQKWWV